MSQKHSRSRNFRGRVSIACVALALAGEALAGAPLIWRESDDYIRVEAAAASNQHPVTFSTEQLTKLLGRFQKIDRTNKPSAYFSEEEIQRIASAATGLFAAADSKTEVVFASSYRPGGFILQPRLLNTGRLFVENGRLNLLIGLCAALPEDPALQDKIRFKELDQGSRSEQAQGLRCQLVDADGAQRVSNRPDWLRLDINTALSAAQPPKLPTSSAPTLSFGQSAEVAKPVAAPIPVTSPTVVAPPRPVASPAPSYPPSEAEERLTTLKRLHSKGLISDAEYDQKRAEVLKSL
jgi:hypothetical protein